MNTNGDQNDCCGLERDTARGFIILAAMLVALALGLICGGCAYKGGKVIDGTNLEIGMTIPGTEWSINFLSYTGGAIVKGNDMTSIEVTNEVAETNSYFGIVETRRHTRLTANITPCEGAMLEAEK